MKEYIEIVLAQNEDMAKDFAKVYGLLRWTFNSASRADTAELGRGLANAIPDMAERSLRMQKPARIGLDGWHGMGKTTFANALLDVFPDRTVLEAGQFNQNTWLLRGGLRLRHYDADAHPDYRLPSCLENRIIEPPFIELIEHAYCEDEKDFDCYIWLNAPESRERDRKIAITAMATPELARTPGFQKFLKFTRLTGPGPGPGP